MELILFMYHFQICIPSKRRRNSDKEEQQGPGLVSFQPQHRHTHHWSQKPFKNGSITIVSVALLFLSTFLKWFANTLTFSLSFSVRFPEGSLICITLVEVWWLDLPPVSLLMLTQASFGLKGMLWIFLPDDRTTLFSQRLLFCQTFVGVFWGVKVFLMTDFFLWLG